MTPKHGYARFCTVTRQSWLCLEKATAVSRSPVSLSGAVRALGAWEPRSWWGGVVRFH